MVMGGVGDKATERSCISCVSVVAEVSTINIHVDIIISSIVAHISKDILQLETPEVRR